MPELTSVPPMTFRAYGRRDIEKMPQLMALCERDRLELKALSAVFPFRVNNYVIEQLIDWRNAPNDPIYRLTFPQPGMLEESELKLMVDLIRKKADSKEIEREARRIQMSLNPHPAGQMELNVPVEDGELINGIQHKYPETILFFPSQGQTCHAYCTYCFRWAQFVGIDDLKFAAKEADQMVRYLEKHPEVSDVLFTGGDPMIMKTKLLRRYIEPLIHRKPGGLRSIRIGTKATAYWPYRFLTDRDADDLMDLFRQVREAGLHLAVMSHYSHPTELSTPAAQAAVARIRSTGAVVRCQAPLIKGVNDHSDIWADMWREQVALGAIPYYMFVERDTGPKHYFELPLAKAYRIFKDAYKRVSGLSRTVRGPSMSATPGKVLVVGVSEIMGEIVFALRFIQARNPDWMDRLFYAKYDEKATWLNDLKPAFGEEKFFFEDELAEMKAEKALAANKREEAIRSQLDLADLPN